MPVHLEYSMDHSNTFKVRQMVVPLIVLDQIQIQIVMIFIDLQLIYLLGSSSKEATYDANIFSSINFINCFGEVFFHLFQAGVFACK